MDFDRLDAILKERHISRRKLALEVGILPGTMSTAFSRRSGLSSSDLMKIAAYLGVSPYRLEGYTVKSAPLKRMPGYSIAEVIKDGKRIGETRIMPSDMTDDELIQEVLEDEDDAKDDSYEYIEPPIITKVINAMYRLNHHGQLEAVKRVEELTEIPRYTTPESD